MNNEERFNLLKYASKFDPKLINFVTLLSVIYLLFLIVELYVEDISSKLIGLIIIDTFICIIFLFEFFYFLFRAKSKKDYFKHHYLDFLASLPFMLFVWISPELAFLNLFKVIRGLKSVLKIYEFLGNKKISRVTSIFVVFLLMVVYFALAVVHFEKNYNHNITGFLDGIWWAVSTISTVGYGDIIPITVYGKITAMIFMLLGIGITSALGAVLVTFLLKSSQMKIIHEEDLMIRIEKGMQEKQNNLSEAQKSIYAKLDKLEKKIDLVVKEKSSAKSKNKTISNRIIKSKK